MNEPPQTTQQQLGSPQVQVVLPNRFGGQKQEVVQVDSNRLSPVAEQRLLWAESMAIPARAEDILIQSACWIAGAGFTVSILRSLPSMIELLVPIVALLLVGLAVTAYTWVQFKHLRPFVIYRLGLVAVGVVMGGVL